MEPRPVRGGAASGRTAAGIPETRSVAPGGRSREGTRLRGVDAARAVAVLGMVMVHFGPSSRPETALGNLYGVSHGRASVLFVLLAGVGVSLLLGGDGRPRGRPWLLRGRLVVRGALLLPLGLWLQRLDHGALVILQYYAVYFAFAALVLTLPGRWLLAGGAAVLLLGPIAYVWGEATSPGAFTRGEPAILGDPAGKLFDDLLLTGAYPLAVWAAPLLVGMWIGRRDLSATRTRWLLLALGLAATLAAVLAADWLSAALGGPFARPFEQPGGPGLSNLLSDEPHAQTPLWLLGSIGSGAAVLGGMLLLAGRLPRAIWPLVATGQMALTVYVGHLLLLHAYPELLRGTSVPEAAFSVGVFVLLAAAVCTLWRSVFPRGPLEAALSAPWWLLERLLRP